MPEIPSESFLQMEKLSPLPYARKEAEMVAQMLGARLVPDTEATKQNMIEWMPKADVIHLATHGLIRDYLFTEYFGAMVFAEMPQPQNSKQRAPQKSPVPAPAESLSSSPAPLVAKPITRENIIFDKNSAVTKKLLGSLLLSSEIRNLKLCARLAVLSACSTGEGKMTSEGW